jgi:GT2 family glycosyltransferase
MLGIARPNRFFAPWEFVESLLSLEGKFKIQTSNGCYIDDNRNDLLYLARNEPWLLMVDSDMVFTKEDVEKMVRHVEDGKDIIAAVCRTGRPPHTYMLYEKDEPFYEACTELPKEPFEIVACHMAFTMMSARAMQRLPFRPFERVKRGSAFLGDDIAFCYRARKAGLKMFCDPSIVVGHITSKTV